ncbi:uncharacterized protein PRCAT00002657001 [Priceomyces carsonii]|uniref:uncharacterized protein n=1 Tax=Priceomyces carsonii TaxID=28549 RepID=UPI002ED7D9CA|nr:unnamed protein product [Priceomyces carsonii]
MEDLVAKSWAALPRYSDKAILPQSVLSKILERFPESNLPHPLIFKIESLESDKYTFIGVKEFSSPSEDLCLLPELIVEKLGSPKLVSISLEENLQKATYLKLKPLQFYSDQNWKFFLENKLSYFYTVLLKGEKIVLLDQNLRYELIVEDLNQDVACIIDTDIDLEIVPLDDTMADQQLHFGKHLDKLENIMEVEDEVQINGIKPFLKSHYIPTIFKLDLTKKPQIFYIVLNNKGMNSLDSLINLDLVVGMDKLVSLEDFRWTTMDQDFKIQDEFDQENFTARKAIKIDRNDNDIKRKLNIESGADDEIDNKWLYFTAFTWDTEATAEITILEEIPPSQATEIDPATHETCPNCGKSVSKSNFDLHEVSCLRENVRCSCGQVFKKTIPLTHWHCDKCDGKFGNSETLKLKHNQLEHNIYKCNQCSSDEQFPTFIDMVVRHKATTCPGKLHECRFCHLILPQGESTYKDKFYNLTNHESSCGNKTTECYKCGKILRSKDLAKHLKLHELDKHQFNEISKTFFNKCSNNNCVNLMSSNPSNELNLCDMCYGPLYVQQHDPTNIKLQSRIERRYMLQLSRGCKNLWCSNAYCITGNPRSSEFGGKSIKEIHALIINHLLVYISSPVLPLNRNRKTYLNQLWFCVNESTLDKNHLVSILQAEEQYGDEMIYKAVNEASTESEIRSWLSTNAIQIHN